MSRKRKNKPGPRGGAGFTLIEILVVVVIVAILVSVTLLSVNVLGRDNQLREETDRLSALIGAVREQAEMQGRDFGLRIYTDGYDFLVYDRREDRWRRLAEALFKPRNFPAGVHPQLFLEAREVVLKSRKDSKPLLQADEEEDDKDKDAAGRWSMDRQNDPGKEVLKPHVFILSSGDLSSFELKLLREGTDHEATLTGKVEGTVEVKNVDAAR